MKGWPPATTDWPGAGGDKPILSVHDADCGEWEKDCIYQPWLVEHGGGSTISTMPSACRNGSSRWAWPPRPTCCPGSGIPANPIVRVQPGGYDEKFCSDGKVFRDGDHWVMFYFGVGRGGAHIMAAFSRDLLHWTAHPEPLYKAGGHPAAWTSICPQDLPRL